MLLGGMAIGEGGEVTSDAYHNITEIVRTLGAIGVAAIGWDVFLRGVSTFAESRVERR